MLAQLANTLNQSGVTEQVALSPEWQLALKLAVPVMILGALLALIIGVRRSVRGTETSDHAMTFEGELRRLDPRRFWRLENVYLPRAHTTGALTRLDHVVMSREGIYVIEVKDLRGVVYGSGRSRRWVHSVDGGEHEFLNPLVQNAGHIEALAAFLELPLKKFHSVVCFEGNAKLKGRMPSNVVRRQLSRYLARRRPRLLSEDELTDAWSRLKHHDRATDKVEAGRQYLAWRSGVRVDPRAEVEMQHEGGAERTQRLD